MINAKVVRFVKINILIIRIVFVAAKMTENKYYVQEDHKNLVTWRKRFGLTSSVITNSAFTGYMYFADVLITT